MNWQVLVLISVVAFSFNSLLQRKLLGNGESDAVAHAIVFQGLVAVYIGIFALIRGFSLPNLWPLLPNLIVMDVFFTAANLLLYKSFQMVEASEVAMLTSTSVIWTATAAILFLGERLGGQQIFGTILVISGAMLISWKKGRLKLSKGHLFALLSATFLGIAIANHGILLRHLDAPSYMVLAFSLPALTSLLIRPKSLRATKRLLSKNIFPKFLLAALFFTISVLSFTLSYQAGGKMSQITPMAQLSTVLIVILSYVFLKERGGLLKKLAGSLLILLGVFFLG